MKKVYVLDTNVLLSDTKSIFAFQDNDLIIPFAVLEELDNQKSRRDEVGQNAREVNRILDGFRQTGSLIEGINLPNGGFLRVASLGPEGLSKLPVELQNKKVDNLIIAFMLQVKDAILVSKDINVRVKCDSLGIQSQDYLNMRVADNTDSFYRGVTVIETSPDEIDEIYAGGTVSPPLDYEKLFPNQIVVMKHIVDNVTKKSALTKVIDGKLTQLRDIVDAFGLKPRNKEQKFALDLLFDDRIKLVTLVGPAGTGKTLLALAAGLAQMKFLGSNSSTYHKMLVSRPIQTVGNDIGFLPGTLQEKMDPWISPIRDNLNFLMGYGNTKRPKPRSRSNDSTVSDEPYLAMLQDQGLIEIEALAYIRGRSIPNSYIVIDEAQNLSIHELKTIITRAGDNTKIVLTGDIEQIDNTHVDIYTNGLSYAVERFKDHAIAGHVSLIKGERSALATLASQIL